MENESQIYQYIQLGELDAVFRKVYNLIVKKGRENNVKNSEEFNEIIANNFVYFQRLQKRVDEIDKKIKDLYIGYDLLFRQKYVFTNKFYSRTEFNLYHIEFFFINLIALFDRYLHLINFLYELNIPDTKLRSVKTLEKEAKKQNKIINIEIINYLNAIHNEIDKTNIRLVQNKIKHKTKYYDQRVNLIDVADFLITQGDNEIMEFKEFIMQEYKRYRKTLRKELEQLIQFSENSTNGLILLLSEKIKEELTKRYFK